MDEGEIMLGEFTGALQICTCAMIIVATFTWFKALRASMKHVDLLQRQVFDLSIGQLKLQTQVSELYRAAKSIHNIETLANLHAKE